MVFKHTLTVFMRTYKKFIGKNKNIQGGMMWGGDAPPLHVLMFSYDFHIFPYANIKQKTNKPTRLAAALPIAPQCTVLPGLRRKRSKTMLKK